MCVNTCMGMRIEMCTDMCIGAHMCTDMCTGISVDMSKGTRADNLMAVCPGMCVGMSVEMCIEHFVHVRMTMLIRVLGTSSSIRKL